MSITKVTYSMINGAYENVLDYGAVGDGVADDTQAIQNAIDAAVTGAGVVYLPAGEYKTTDSINIYGAVSVVGAGMYKTIIKPISTVTEAVQIGNVATSADAHSGEIRDFSVDRGTYSGATSSGGFVFYWSYQSSLVNLESRLYKYNFWFKPQNGQAVAYMSLYNMSAVGGYYNVFWDAAGTGYANEITFYSGRMFSTTDTHTQVYWDGGSNNRFENMSCEGEGNYSIYIGGAGNFILQPRTEGTWSSINIAVSPTALRTLIIDHSFYTYVSDGGEGTTYITHNSGSKFSSTLDSTVTTTFDHSAAVDGTNVEFVNNRWSNTDYAWKSSETATSSNPGWLTTQGEMYADRRFKAGQSAWNFNPLILGVYYFWVDSSGRLRIKNGAPASDTDGTIVGTQS